MEATASGGGGGLHCTGKFRSVAYLFHQGNGKCASCDHIGHGGTIDGAHQGAGYHRGFRWTTLHPAGEGIGDVNEKLACPEYVQQFAKDDIQRHKGHTGAHAGAEDRLAGPGHIICDIRDVIATVSNNLRHLGTGYSVSDEDSAQNGQRPAHRPPCQHHNSQNKQHAHNNVQISRTADATL